jgi:hypothetical protein
MGNLSSAVPAGGLAVTKFERLNSVLGYEFDRYVMEHPDFADKIPLGATVVLLLEGEDAFNKWARSIAERNRAKDKDENGPVLYVRIKGLRPPKSRLIRPVIAKSA